jgi:hypothetical protein
VLQTVFDQGRGTCAVAAVSRTRVAQWQPILSREGIEYRRICEIFDPFCYEGMELVSRQQNTGGHFISTQIASFIIALEAAGTKKKWAFIFLPIRF